MSYKDRFMLANCQFVLNIADVRETGDNLVNPDKTVEWQKVILVRIFCAKSSSDLISNSNNGSSTAITNNDGSEVALPDCPICFHPPVAAKITHCGHVYCWPCMLHYLALAEKDWQKCPVCSEPVYLRDLKSCMPLSTTAGRVERGTRSALTMVMMQRDASSAVPLPHHLADPHACGGNSRLLELLRYGSIPNQNFAKILYMDNEQIRNEVFEWERDQLMVLLQEEQREGSTEVMFVQQALQILDQQLDMLFTGRRFGGDDGESAVHSPVPNGNVSSEEEKVNGSNSKRRNQQSDKARRGVDQQQSRQPQQLPPRIRSLSQRSMSTCLDGHDAYARFYQSEDGQLIYLSSLSHRMLLHEYGNNMLDMPDVIDGDVIDVERVTVTDDTRRRYKFLRHLPRMAEVLLVELDMREPTIGEHTRLAFQREVNNRAAARAQRHLREMRLKEKAEKSLYPLWYQIKERHTLYRRGKYNGTEVYGRELRPEDFICEGGLPAPMSSSPPGQNSNVVSANEMAGGSAVEAASDSNLAPSFSFAKIVRDGQKPRVERVPSEVGAPPPARIININANDESEFPSLGSFSPPAGGAVPSSSTTPMCSASGGAPLWKKNSRTRTTSNRISDAESKSASNNTADVNEAGVDPDDDLLLLTPVRPVTPEAREPLSVSLDAEADFPSLVSAPAKLAGNSNTLASRKSKVQKSVRKLVPANDN